jgi:hypothetical protein
VRRSGRLRHGLPAIALIASAGAQGAVPRGGAEEADIAVFRARGYPACLAVNPLVARGGRVNANAIEECHCAVDRLIEERAASGLPELDAGSDRTLFAPHLESCRGGKPGAGKVPVVAAPPIGPGDTDASGAKPSAEAAAGAPAEAEAEAPAVPAAAEVAKPEAPAWLAWTGLPSWSLWLIPVFALLAGLVLLTTRRRRGERGDLIGPPPSMRGNVDVGPGERE